MTHSSPNSWTLIPVVRGTKRPAISWAAIPPGTKHPISPDQDTGLVCGARSGVFAIDLDVKDGKEGPANFRRLSPEGRAPQTLINRTPSGGYHLLFACPPGLKIKTSVEELGRGIDVRGEGGYIVIPPSRGYAWANDAPIANAPSWLLELVRDKPRDSQFTNRESSMIPAGQRDNTLIKMAGSMRRAGLSPEAILVALREVNRTQCQPPLTDEEVIAKARQAEKWSPGQVGELKGGPTPGFIPLTREQMLAPVPPPNHLIPALDIGPGRPVQILGMGSAGKSLVAQAVMLAIVGGVRVFGHFEARQGPCAWIDFEMGCHPSLRRLRRLASGMGLVWDDIVDQMAFASMPRTYLNSTDAEDHLVALCTIPGDPGQEDRHRAAIFIDSLRRGVPGVDENDSAISEFLQMLLRVSERTGTTVLFLHHSSTKVAPEGLDARGKGRGSSAIYDGSGAVFHLSGALGEPVTVTQTRVGEAGTRADEFQVVIRDVAFNGDAKAGLEVVWAEEQKPSKGKELQNELLDVIRAENFAGSGVSVRRAIVRFGEAREAAGKKSVRRETIITTLEDLVRDERIEDLNVGGKEAAYWLVGYDAGGCSPRSPSFPTVPGERLR
jgi:hypothetical protein